MTHNGQTCFRYRASREFTGICMSSVASHVVILSAQLTRLLCFKTEELLSSLVVFDRVPFCKYCLADLVRSYVITPDRLCFYTRYRNEEKSFKLTSVVLNIHVYKYLELYRGFNQQNVEVWEYALYFLG